MSNTTSIPSEWTSAPAVITPPGQTGLPATPIIPTARCAISVRPATMKDVPFIDQLQKMHTHMVGWFPTKQIEGKISLGQVVIAEDGTGNEQGPNPNDQSNPNDQASIQSKIENQKSKIANAPIGYCIGHDQYMGRDDVGIIYQLNVMPLKQRHLIGASLIKAMFERAAYGCRLFCCWCAQDIQANYFWESIGFVPLAFRTGSRGKQRIHIFWQRRVRENDVTTPYWFPAQTKSGLIREDRLVLPIPPGTHWRDAKPIVLPGVIAEAAKPKALPPTRPPAPKEEVSTSRRMAIARSQSKHLKGTPAGKAAVITAGGIRYIERGDYQPPAPEPKPKRAPSAPRAKNDPKHVAAARELRDRWLEQVNSGQYLPESVAKYEVGRQLDVPERKQSPLLIDQAPIAA